jgi:hypothetical protein
VCGETDWESSLVPPPPPPPPSALRNANSRFPLNGIAVGGKWLWCRRSRAPCAAPAAVSLLMASLLAEKGYGAAAAERAGQLQQPFTLPMASLLHLGGEWLCCCVVSAKDEPIGRYDHCGSALQPPPPPALADRLQDLD